MPKKGKTKMTDNQNNDSGNLGFKMKVSEFRGYVTRALGEFEREFKEAREERGDLNEKIDTNCKAIEDKMEMRFTQVCKKVDNVNTRVTNLYIKVGSIGGAVALVISILFWLLKDRLFRGGT